MKEMNKTSFINRSICIVLFLLVSQCDATLDPLDQSNGSFSVHGTVNMDNEIHFFRVNDLKATLQQETVPAIDARVTLENITTGNSVVLPDSMVNFDGVFTHNFFTEDIEYGNIYELTVERLSGRGTIKGRWTTPRRASMEIEGLPAERTGCNDPITMTYAPVSEISEIDLRIFRLGDPEIKSFRPPFVKHETDESVTAVFTMYDISKAIYGVYTRDCRNFEAGGQLLFKLTHYGPDYFEDNITGGINDQIKVGLFGALYKEESIYLPFKD